MHTHACIDLVERPKIKIQNDNKSYYLNIILSKSDDRAVITCIVIKIY